MDYNNCLKDKLKDLPEQPGVYLMHDSLGNIIYVGKAKNLKNRVSQYFYKQKSRDPKVEEMILRIADWEYRIVDTELDALLEECRLIKELKPHYNRQMKNHQKYVYIRIPDESFPKVDIVQEREEGGGVYYGPFSSRHWVETAVECLSDIFLIRKCSAPGRGKGRNGCLYRQLGTCAGVCTGKVSSEEYRERLKAVCQAIEAGDKEAMKELSSQLARAVEALNFETAARYREYLLGLRYIQGRQKFLKGTCRNKNLLALEDLDTERKTVKVFLIKGNRVLMSRVLTWLDENLKQFLREIPQALADQPGCSRQLTQEEVDEAQILDSYLRKDRVISIPIPQKALKQGEFVEGMLKRIKNKKGDNYGQEIL
ncbi:GIY-YIG nuclease family protein [Desulfitobacterium chlororespirans]|uniref:Excinuclease ABC subunit C n=1 Tax=Desulfitobacterium chlororespirans DSM 11544 TaxID=1121395 RepID=A0A1M7TYB9_9FIRM|nr:GIY-YIG nuclease family protein [Desulfitobacterium chlororespirans]SHN75762.1 excinuclease ABC subunit C [Desulfitobacterium chlororespirans DSM 11544]